MSTTMHPRSNDVDFPACSMPSRLNQPSNPDTRYCLQCDGPSYQLQPSDSRGTFSFSSSLDSNFCRLLLDVIICISQCGAELGCVAFPNGAHVSRKVRSSSLLSTCKREAESEVVGWYCTDCSVDNTSSISRYTSIYKAVEYLVLRWPRFVMTYLLPIGIFDGLLFNDTYM